MIISKPLTSLRFLSRRFSRSLLRCLRSVLSITRWKWACPMPLWWSTRSSRYPVSLKCFYSRRYHQRAHVDPTECSDSSRVNCFCISNTGAAFFLLIMSLKKKRNQKIHFVTSLSNQTCCDIRPSGSGGLLDVALSLCCASQGFLLWNWSWRQLLSASDLCTEALSTQTS